MYCVVIYLTILRSTISLLPINMAFGKGTVLKPILSPSLTIGFHRWTSKSGRMYSKLIFQSLLIRFPTRDSYLNLTIMASLVIVFLGSRTFLLECTQCLQVSGTRSYWISVTSGVPEGTVLGPFLFLIYINDIVDNLNSKIELFADDAVLYSEVSNVQDVNLLTLYPAGLLLGK